MLVLNKIVLDRIREYGTRVRDGRKRRKAVNLDIGDLVLANDSSKGFCFTPGKEYAILNICPIHELRGFMEFYLRNVLFKLADDNGTIKEVSYSVFDY